ncbi:MAG: hypothetical protein CVV27_19130 [Candidatus Melainabacteria bacterium HGW-Melainabacteria-1]|nr:MAG: hypothetical protein CVV27_19130 [Candidatus Melainabacteria bacterium HGW-Melainabacteria-1]
MKGISKAFSILSLKLVLAGTLLCACAPKADPNDQEQQIQREIKVQRQIEVQTAQTETAPPNPLQQSQKRLAIQKTDRQDMTGLTSLDPELTRFSQLVMLAGMQDLLRRKEITILAPRDQAFQKMSNAQWALLIKDKASVKHLVQNHLILKIVPLKEFSSLAGGQTTVAGETLTTTRTTDGVVYLQEARVLSGDLRKGQALLHVIDRVLTPLSPSAGS